MKEVVDCQLHVGVGWLSGGDATHQAMGIAHVQLPKPDLCYQTPDKFRIGRHRISLGHLVAIFGTFQNIFRLSGTA